MQYSFPPLLIILAVVRCYRFRRQTNGWRWCSPSWDMRYGTTCEFGCYRGFRLAGPQSVYCDESGIWNVSSQPTCESMTHLSLFILRFLTFFVYPFPKQALVFTCLQYKSLENFVGKGEIARNEQFLLFPQCFLPVWITFFHFRQI